MKTESINVMNLCVPCENRCRYCLLSYDGKVAGADNWIEVYDINDERQCFSRRY